MPTFSDLSRSKSYLIRIDADSDVEFINVLMQTEKCLLVRSFLPETEDFFVLKEDVISEIIEELDDLTVEEFNSVYGETDQD